MDDPSDDPVYFKGAHSGSGNYFMTADWKHTYDGFDAHWEHDRWVIDYPAPLLKRRLVGKQKMVALY